MLEGKIDFNKWRFEVHYGVYNADFELEITDKGIEIGLNVITWEEIDLIRRNIVSMTKGLDKILEEHEKRG